VTGRRPQQLRLVAGMTLAFGAFIAGCENAAVRCSRVMAEDLHARATRRREERVLELLATSPGYATFTPDQSATRLRVLRAKDAEDLRARLVANARESGDTSSIRRLEAEDRAQDSVRPIAPPPRPSDWAWYGEHCYEGKPR
jgi:hypothetical protein